MKQAKDYSSIFMQVLREQGGLIPTGMLPWTFSSLRNRWYTFVQAARRDPDLEHLVLGRKWGVEEVLGEGVKITVKMDRAQAAIVFLGEIKGG